MGWSYGIVDGKEVGYSVPDVCNHPECDAEIDRGLSYACGGIMGNGSGCDGFFCGRHLNYTGIGQLCDACVKSVTRDFKEECPECDCDPLSRTGGGHADKCPAFEPEWETVY